MNYVKTSTSFYLYVLVMFHTRQNESTLSNCLNINELLAQNRREIGILSDCNWTRTQQHLVRKLTLSHLAKQACLAKWLSVRLRAKWFWVRVQLQSVKLAFMFFVYFLFLCLVLNNIFTFLYLQWLICVSSGQNFSL